MTFASWFELIPRLKNFRPLMCAGPNLTIEEGLKGCAWRLTVGFSIKKIRSELSFIVLEKKRYGNFAKLSKLGKISALSKPGVGRIDHSHSSRNTVFPATRQNVVLESKIKNEHKESE